MIFHFAHAVKVTDNASVRKFKMAFYALRVTQIDVSAAEKPGMVNVQRLEFDGVKYQEININKITLVNVARVIPPDFIS